MSMLTEQCAELRTLAGELREIKEHNTDWLHMEAVTLASSVDAMREAADTIESCETLFCSMEAMCEAADTIESLRERLQAETLGAGECKMLPSNCGMTCIVRHESTGLEMEFGYWRCSACGCNNFEGAKYCMECGRKAVGA